MASVKQVLQDDGELDDSEESVTQNHLFGFNNLQHGCFVLHPTLAPLRPEQQWTLAGATITAAPYIILGLVLF